VRRPGDQAAGGQGVDQAGDVARAHVQGLGQDPLGARATVVQLPQQVGAGDGQAVGGQAPGHVVVQQDGELEHLPERPTVFSSVPAYRDLTSLCRCFT